MMYFRVNWARDSPGRGENPMGLDMTNDNIRWGRKRLKNGRGRLDKIKVTLPYHLSTIINKEEQ